MRWAYVSKCAFVFTAHGYPNDLPTSGPLVPSQPTIACNSFGTFRI